MKLFYAIILTLFVSMSVFSQDYMGCKFGVSTTEVKTYFDKMYNRNGEILNNVVVYQNFYQNSENKSMLFYCNGGTFKNATVQYLTATLDAGKLKYSSVYGTFTKLYGKPSETEKTSNAEMAGFIKQQGIHAMTIWNLSGIKIQVFLMKNNNVWIVHSPIV